jgi:hypothetical protein
MWDDHVGLAYSRNGGLGCSRDVVRIVGLAATEAAKGLDKGQRGDDLDLAVVSKILALPQVLRKSARSLRRDHGRGRVDNRYEHHFVRESGSDLVVAGRECVLVRRRITWQLRIHI